MFLDTITMAILAVYLYVLFVMIGKDDYSSMLILTLVVCIVLCWRRRGGFVLEGFHPSEMAYLDAQSPQDQMVWQNILLQLLIVLLKNNNLQFKVVFKVV